MKRICLAFLLAITSVPAIALRAQDLSPAAVAAGLQELEEEKRRIYSELTAAQESNARLERRMTKLESEMERLGAENRQLRDSVTRSGGNYATQEQLREVARQMEGVDKRREDGDKTVAREIKEILSRELSEFDKSHAHTTTARIEPSRSETPAVSEKHTAPRVPERKQLVEPPLSPAPDAFAGEYYEHVVATNETLAKIIAAYNSENGLKVRVNDVLKANPKLKDPRRLFVGQKIRIPAIK